MRRFVFVLLAACGSSTASAPAGRQPTTSEPSPVASPRSGDDAMGEQRRALAEIDVANPRTVDRATKAADALGEARHGAAIPELGALAVRPPEQRIAGAQVAALRALGKMTDKRAASAALASVVTRALPRRSDEAYALHLATLGAAINAIGELADPAAVASLVPVAFRTPELMMQLRRAYATSPAVAAEFRKVLRGEHAAVEAVLKDQAGDKPVSTREYYSALVLGDLRDASAIPDLLAALERPALPSYYVDGDPAPNTQHNAIFDALQRIGSPEPAAKLMAIWSNPRADVLDRAGAISVYGRISPDAAGSDALAKIAADNSAQDAIRVEAALAYARLARDKKHDATFLTLARKYTDAAAKKRALADKQQAVKQAADGELADARDKADAARAKLLATTQDQSTTAEQIRAQTDVAKRAEEDFKAAKKQHRDKISVFTMNDSHAKEYVGYARMFQTHLARIELAIRCAEAVDCYAAALRTTPADAVLQLRTMLPGADKWTDEEKQGLVEAYVDRATLELGRRKATAKLDALLDALANENRVIREAILLVLPKLAPTPCPACVTKLDAAIESGRSKTYLAAVQLETQIVRNYLAHR